jgi:hypothetical protein
MDKKPKRIAGREPRPADEQEIEPLAILARAVDLATAAIRT